MHYDRRGFALCVLRQAGGHPANESRGIGAGEKAGIGRRNGGMRTTCVLAIALLSLATSVRADDFAKQVDLSPLATAAVQDNQTMKTLDTFARQAIWQITGHEKLDDHDSVYPLLDMSFHPDEYVTRNIVKIANVPLREEFENLQSIDETEKKRIVKEGTVSLAFLERPEVQSLLAQGQASSVNKSKAIEQGM